VGRARTGASWGGGHEVVVVRCLWCGWWVLMLTRLCLRREDSSRDPIRCGIQARAKIPPPTPAGLG